MKVDVIAEEDTELVEKLKRLGFERIFFLRKGRLFEQGCAESAGLNVYNGADYTFTIQKGRADVITDLERNNFLLDKGLCSKLKENKMLVLFKFRSLIESEDLFRCYKNMVINGKLCNDYSVSALYCSFSRGAEDIKSPTQLVAFAAQFGYNYENYSKAAAAVAEKY